MKRNTPIQPIQSKKDNLHLYKNWYLTSNKIQFIVYEKAFHETGKNIGIEYQANSKYFPSLEFLFKYLLGATLQEELSKNQIESINEMQIKYNQFLQEIKEIAKEIRFEKK